MLIELAAAAFLIGSYIYHRLTEPSNQGERGVLAIPIAEEGEPRPKLFGRDRIRRPVLEWISPVAFEERVSGAVYELRANVFFTLASGFQHGNGTTTPVATNRLHSIYVGDQKLGGILNTLTGNGAFESTSVSHSDLFIAGNVEFLNGGPAQVLVNGGATTYAGDRMMATSPHGSSLSEDVIAGYRQRLSVCMFQNAVAGGFNHGRVQALPAYQFEASSYAPNHPQLGLYARVGDDSNPINVIFEVLTSPLDMLGLPESLIDITSFQAAQYTLHTESHGYSRYWDRHTPARDIINDVLRQIDGFLYEDQRTGKLCIRLARNDYDPATLDTIDRSNCRKITGFAMNSRANIVNKVRVVFEDRDKDYADNSATAQNMANAVGQDGQVVEEVIEYRGCKNATTAVRLAGRELGIRSKPIVKLTAHVSRSFLRKNIGDVVKVVWNAPDINAVFRVVGVDRGSPGDETIRLDLLLDANYVWRGQAPIPPDTGGIDMPPVVLGG